ncbi:MAG: hypothetical protein LBC82_04770 [Oscillospiraceae bacterium]|nr:hypothetical protein [Oscillospiraceae bacterium]
MKIKKCILSAFVFMAISFAFFCGCQSAKVNDKNTTPFLPEKEETYEEHNDPVPIGDPAPLTIWIEKGTDFKEKIIEHINIAKNPNENNDIYNVYPSNRISNLTEFYLSIKIIDFELFCVSISEYGFIYYYAPVEKLRQREEYSFSNTDGVEIVIERSDSKIPTNLNKIAQGNSKLTDDNFVYDGNNQIWGQIRDTVFRITVPNNLNNYEFLRDLAFRLIETSEVVDVQAEIDIIRQSEN